ncbi:hypothetical protein JCM30237_08470 [Halolamina litorea]|uniref:Uncharacterized protein n=1 Tax=Halolamina litorea TaxID=1515593 RepID=A0ABD6BQH4_9EURY|nr:hypothetical protein [Halolamina litorea]
MPSNAIRLGFLAAIAAGTLLVASTLAEVPQLRLAGTAIPTQFVVGVVAGGVTLVVAVSMYRGGDRRSALQFGLLGVGVPLALTDWRGLATIGALLTLLSVPVAWRVDSRVRERVGDTR